MDDLKAEALDGCSPIAYMVLLRLIVAAKGTGTVQGVFGLGWQRAAALTRPDVMHGITELKERGLIHLWWDRKNVACVDFLFSMPGAGPTLRVERGSR